MDDLDKAARTLARHLNAIGNHASVVEEELSSLLIQIPNIGGKAEMVEILAIIRTLLEAWDRIARKMQPSDE